MPPNDPLDETVAVSAPGVELRGAARESARTATSRAPTDVTHEEPERYAGGDEELGRGGMGRVLAAFDTHLQREVALKELILDDPGATARFLAEARLTGRLEHPGIVPVHELGQRPDGTFYYSMKRIRGQSLAEALAACDSRDERLRLLPRVVDVCQTVAYAHSRGVIHRDLKPANVMLGAFGETLVIDWGLAKVVGDPASPRALLAAPWNEPMELEAVPLQTLPGQAMGTPAYMSPEQARGSAGEIDARADVWSLGVMLYEVVVGRRPFRGGTPAELLAAVARARVTPMRTAVPDVDPALAAIAGKALRRRPEERYAGADALAADLQAWLDGRLVGAHTYSAAQLARQLIRRNPFAAASLLALTLTLVSAGVLLVGAFTRARDASDVAEHERAAAIESERGARDTLAAALLEKAERAAAEGDGAAAAVYAAASLVELPSTADPDRAAVARSIRDRAEATWPVVFERKLMLPVEGDELGTYALAFSPDGRRLGAVLRTGGAAVWDLAAPMMPPRLLPGEPFGNNPGDLTWSAGGDLLAYSRIVDGASEVALAGADGQLRRTLPTGSGPCKLARTLRFAPTDDRLAIGCSSGLLEVVDLASEDHLSVQTGNRVHDLAWGPRGDRIVVVGLNRSALAVDATTGAETWRTPLAFGPSGVDVAPDGRVAITGAANHVEILQLGDGQTAGGIPTDTRPGVVRFSPSGDLLLHGSEAGAVIRESGGPILHQLAAVDVSTAVWSPDGRRLAVAGHGPGVGVRLWRLRDPDAGPLSAGVRLGRFDVSRSGHRIVAVAADHTVVVFEQAPDEPWTNRPLPHPADEGPLRSVTLCPAADCYAVSTRFGEVSLRSLQDGAQLRRLRDRGRTSRYAAWTARLTADGETVYMPDGRGVRAVREGDETVRWEGHEAAVWDLALSPSERQLATVSYDGTALLWDVGTGEQSRVFDASTPALSVVAFSPDETELAVGGAAGVVFLWDVSTGDLRGRLEGHTDWISSVEYSPDGATILTSSSDSTVRLWDLGGRRARRIHRSREPVPDAHFAPDGSAIWFVDGEDLVRISLDSTSEEHPAQRLRELEAAAGVRLEGLELVPTAP